MCGIFGFMNGTKREVNADDFMKSGFFASMLRGTDSSGIASIDTKSGVAVIHKLPVSGNVFVQDKFAHDLIKDATDVDTISIGHVRAATVGKIGYNEAHPFQILTQDRELVGVHNGTLSSWKSNASAKDYDVDSEWALNMIFDKGKDAFKAFFGAYCFVWWDSDSKETLNIALDDGRTMYVVMTEQGGMAYASEAGMLYWLCERHNIKMKGKVRKLQSHNWYKFKMNDCENYTKETLEKATSNYTPYTGPAYNHNYSSVKTMDKVEALLIKIGLMKEAQPSLPLAPAAPSAPLSVMATQAEQQSARDLAMMNEQGYFEPSHVDKVKGLTYGRFVQGDSLDMDAIVRLTSIEFDQDTVWKVTCIGLVDDGTNLTAVCDRPSMFVKMKKKNHDTVH